MTTEWPRIGLGQVVRNFDARRIPLSGREREKRRGPYRYFGATGVMAHVDKFLFEGLHLLIAEDGSVERPDGKPFLQLVDGQFWVNNHAHVLQGATDDDTRFIYYALSTVPVRPYVSGSVQAKLSQSSMNRISVPYPTEGAVRRAIGRFLFALDEKIELNRRVSGTLEATARALFTRTCARGAAVRGRWKREALGLHLEVARGVSYDGDAISGAGVPFHNLNSIYEGGGYKYEGIKTFAGEVDDRRAVVPGDVIVANTEQGHERLLLASAALVPSCFGPRTPFSHHLYRVRPKPGSPLRPTYIAYLLNSPRFHDLVSRYGNGTTVNMLPADALSIPEISVPPKERVDEFEKVVAPMHARMECAILESQTLRSLRDALLPRLISGEIRVGIAAASSVLIP